MSRLALLTTLLTTWSVKSFAPLPHLQRQQILPSSSLGWSLAQGNAQQRAMYNPLQSFMSSGLGIASDEEITKATQDPNVVFVDIRGDGEIKEAPFGRPYVHTPGSPDENQVLQNQADELIPNKNACVVVFCASGRRAKKAKEVLEDKGYTNVLNAGGISNLNKCLA